MRRDIKAPREVVERAHVARAQTVQRFVSMTPAQVDEWIQAQAVDMSGVVTVLKMLAKIVLVLARKEFTEWKTSTRT